MVGVEGACFYIVQLVGWLFWVFSKKQYLVNYSELIQKEIFNFPKHKAEDWASPDLCCNLYLFVTDLKKRTAMQELDDDRFSKISKD